MKLPFDFVSQGNRPCDLCWADKKSNLIQFDILMWLRNAQICIWALKMGKTYIFSNSMCTLCTCSCIGAENAFAAQQQHDYPWPWEHTMSEAYTLNLFYILPVSLSSMPSTHRGMNDGLLSFCSCQVGGIFSVNVPSNHVPCCLLEPCCLITAEGEYVLSVICET